MIARAPLASPTSNSSVGVRPAAPVGRLLGSLLKRCGRRPTMSTCITSALHKPTFLQHSNANIGLQVLMPKSRLMNTS